jgi:hypothetical protein
MTAELGRLAGRPSIEQRLATRSGLVLAVLRGAGIRPTALHAGCNAATVREWVRRAAAAWHENGVTGLRKALSDAPRPGRPSRHGEQARRDLTGLATAAPPRPYARWTHLLLAQAMRALPVPVPVSPSWVRRTLADLRIAVHKVTGWIHRRDDPQFNDRVEAVQTAVGNAATDRYPVLSLDEKTAYSVRTPTRPDTHDQHGTRRREFEYQRRGTIGWYGIQDCKNGTVSLTRATGGMNSTAFITVLEDLTTLHGPVFTLIMDNGPAHTSRATRAWLAEHPGITVCHTPAHASWVNPIESVFGILARQVLRHGWFTNPDDVDDHVQEWTTQRNKHHHPVTFTWTSHRVTN